MKWVADEKKVAAGKQSMEIALREAIEELKTSLQEMEIYKRVYPEPNLGAIIAKVFKGITNFSRNATKYFKGEGRCKLVHGCSQLS